MHTQNKVITKDNNKYLINATNFLSFRLHTHIRVCFRLVFLHARQHKATTKNLLKTLLAMVKLRHLFVGRFRCWHPTDANEKVHVVDTVVVGEATGICLCINNPLTRSVKELHFFECECVCSVCADWRHKNADKHRSRRPEVALHYLRTWRDWKHEWTHRANIFLAQSCRQYVRKLVRNHCFHSYLLRNSYLNSDYFVAKACCRRITLKPERKKKLREDKLYLVADTNVKWLTNPFNCFRCTQSIAIITSWL